MIELAGIEKSYGDNRVLCGLDLTVAAGTFLSIMGSSGSGKSTLLNLIGGIDRPDRGRIIVNEEEITGYSEGQLTLYRRKRVGYVFQFFNLLPNLTAYENVEMPLLLNGAKGYEERITAQLGLVGLGGKEGAYPHELSGGEQQRVAICRALIHDPDVILADEPTGNLDSRIGRHIMELLKGIAVRRGKTVILVTHDVVVAGYGTRTIRIKDGTIGQ